MKFVLLNDQVAHGGFCNVNQNQGQIKLFPPSWISEIIGCRPEDVFTYALELGCIVLDSFSIMQRT